MPIEFRCPSCSKLLRTPDESAGKKAKCPQCGTIADVPGAAGSGFAAPLPSGGFSPFSAPDPLGIPTEAAGIGPPPKSYSLGNSDSQNPYATPTSAGTTVGFREPIEEGPRTGLPWEIGPKSAKTYWATTKLILSSPSEAFGLMFRTGGVGTPLGFLVIGGLIGGIFSGIYNTLLQLGMLTFVTAAGGQNQPNMAGFQWIQVAIQIPIAIAGGTIGAMIGSFITAGIYHLFLKMLGGARFEYETTYRVVAYVNGAVALLQVIPLCGQYAMGIIALIYSIIALSNAHRTTGGKAAGAVLLPVVLCIGFVIVIVAGIFAVGFSFTANR